MHIKIQVVIEEASGETTIEDLIYIDKRCESGSTLGLSLLESFLSQTCAFITALAPTHRRNHSACYPSGYPSIPVRN